MPNALPLTSSARKMRAASASGQDDIGNWKPCAATETPEAPAPSAGTLEVLARLHDLDPARAAYIACRAKYPAKIIYLCQGGRTLRRSDRDVSEVRTL